MNLTGVRPSSLLEQWCCNQMGGGREEGGRGSKRGREEKWKEKEGREQEGERKQATPWCNLLID